MMPASSNKNVHITNDKGGVDNFEIHVSKRQGDQVTWFAFGTAGATIRFSSPDGSPFQESVFYVPATGSVTSGPAKTNVVYKSYKYTVVGAAGSNDPAVIIDN
jgi:hypothetical protein